MRKFFPIIAICLVCQLLLVYGCSKPDDPPPQPPTTPTIISISSEDAAPGDTISMAGTNFSVNTSDNIVTVNGTTVTVVQASATKLIISLPQSLVSGNVTIVVSVNNQTASYSFAYTRPSVIVTTFAGSKTGFGYKDGKGSDANFLIPTAITIDANGNLFVCDLNSHRIRKIAPDGTVTTFAGDGTNTIVGNAPAPQSIGNPTGIVVDRSSGDLYVVQSGLTLSATPHIVRKITAAGVTSVVASLANQHANITIDGAGNLYISEDMQIRKITPAGVITLVAGKGKLPNLADPGNGPINNALIGVAKGLLFNGSDFFFGDWSTNSIRKISAMTTVSTYAGVEFAPGWIDGTVTTAKFSLPTALAMNAAGDLFVADAGSSSIRKITAAGNVTTIAGSRDGKFGYRDGNGKYSLFNNPTGLAIDAAGNLYVCDEGNNCIRKITF